MGDRKFGADNFVCFYPEGHRYIDENGKEYTSVTKITDSIKKPFPRDMISYLMAKARFAEGTVDEIIRAEQQKILDEWERKRDFAAEHGTRIHKEMENYFRTGEISDKLAPVAKKVSQFYKHHYKHFDEIILYSEKDDIAGTTDKAVARSKKLDIIDFSDYKTNFENGITFDSHKEKNDKFTFENKYFLEPFTHIEECNYYQYALQLSIYAYNAEVTYGIKVGKLNIIFINEEKSLCDIIPVPYLRNDVQVLYVHRKMLRDTGKSTRSIMIDENIRKREGQPKKEVNDEVW